jgi:predicted aspartyl protease
VRCFDNAGGELVVPHLAGGVIVADDMGTFRVDIEIENTARPGERAGVHAVLVDTGSELTWVPGTVLESMGIQRIKQLRFRQATGAIVVRWTGAATIYAAGTQTADEIVFGEPGDLSLLGSRTLEGLNVVVDPIRRQLVVAGAMPAACAA